MNMPTFLTPLDINKEREEILSLFKERLKSELDMDYTELVGDNYNILISCILYYLGLKIDKINYIIANNYLEYSSGEYLDALVGLLGLKRFSGSPPIATINVICKDSCIISKGTKFASSDGANAYAMSDYNLQKGDNTLTLQGDKVGKWDTITLEIKNPLITEITMQSEFVIYEPSEDDESLRKRFLNALASFSTAGSRESYTHFASVGGVGKIKAISPQKGVVKIVYYPHNAGAEELISQNLEGNIPLTDKVLIAPAEVIAISLHINLTLDINANFTLIQNEIANNIESFFSEIAIGEEVSHNKIISLCFVNDSVLDCEVNEISEITQDSIYELESITIQKK